MSLTKAFICAASAVVFAGATLSAQASVFSFEYNDTVSSSTIAGLSAGNAAKITVNLDNGASSLSSQTWTAAHLQSVSFDFNNGGLLTTFTAPFGGGGLSNTLGSFATDAGGALTAVMTSWLDNTGVGGDFSTNGGTPHSWFLNGFNGVYQDTNFNTVRLANVSSMLNAASWTPVSAPASVPVPATLWLLVSGLASLGVIRKRRAV